MFCFEIHGYHRDLHVLTHSFPTRLSSDLLRVTMPCFSSAATVFAMDCGVTRSNFANSFAVNGPCRSRWPRAWIWLGVSLWSWRSEEHTSELQSLMRISYAVFCLKKKQTYKSRQTLYIATAATLNN